MTHLGLSLDPATNDLHLDGDGALIVVRDAAAVGQHARQRLMTYRGEWFLDTAAGVPWLSDIMGKAFDAALAEAVVKGEILDTDGVTAIESFSVGFAGKTRALIIKDVSVLTVYDEATSL